MYCELSSKFCLLALDCCCSFHLFATYISSFWATWCAFTFFESLWIFLDSSVFYQMCLDNFWKVLFCLNDVIDIFLKISLKFLSICKIFLFFLMVLVTLGRNWLYVIMIGILSDFCCVSFSIIRSILLSRLFLLRCLLINDELYPCFTKLFFISLKLLLKSTWFELIPFIRVSWL